MCLIIVKDNGVEMPTRDFLEDVWEVNPDGAGVMWRSGKTGEVSFVKGFMKEEDLYLFLDKMDFKFNDQVAIHLRWATSGKVDAQTCHPFISSRDKKQRRITTDIKTTKTIFMHNGVIDDLNDKKTVSDTQRFARWYMPEINMKSLYTSKAVQKMITKFVDDSRLCIMDKRHGMLLTGEWVDGKNGLKLSKVFKKKDKTPWAKTSGVAFGGSWSRGSAINEGLFKSDAIYYCDYCLNETASKTTEIENQDVCIECRVWAFEEQLNNNLPKDFNMVELNTVLSFIKSEYKAYDYEIRELYEWYKHEALDEVQ